MYSIISHFLLTQLTNLTNRYDYLTQEWILTTLSDKNDRFWRCFTWCMFLFFLTWSKISAIWSLFFISWLKLPFLNLMSLT